MVDSHLNLRYNMTEDVYEGEKGFTEIQFKLGMGFWSEGKLWSKKIDLLSGAEYFLKYSFS